MKAFGSVRRRGDGTMADAQRLYSALTDMEALNVCFRTIANVQVRRTAEGVSPSCTESSVNTVFVVYKTTILFNSEQRALKSSGRCSLPSAS
jgi:hypothetical protein